MVDDEVVPLMIGIVTVAVDRETVTVDNGELIGASLFLPSRQRVKVIIPVYIFYHYYPGLSYVENHMSIYFDKATLISP